MIDHFLTLLRDRDTNTKAFREAAHALASLIAQEIGAKMPLELCEIETPMGKTSGSLFEKRVILIPILRAGLAFLPAFLDLFQTAAVGFLGIRREEKNAHPHLYYENIPDLGAHDFVFLLDPMLATGGTANLALDKLAQKGAAPAKTFFATVLAAQSGLDEVRARHSQVKIHAAAIDPHLDSKKFIVPGLGDFGDRYFGT